MSDETTLLTIQEASAWASEHLKRKVTPSNISYLIQYGRVEKFSEAGVAKVSRQELEEYYRSYFGGRESNWKAELGANVNWALSFEKLKETDTTKHVHRLHPYKGKFIPQLVEYFLDGHTDEFKKTVYFHPGDVVLDPFCGSGTTLVEANELGLHAVGIDVSEFNALISNIKVERHNLADVQKAVLQITQALKEFIASLHVFEFEEKLTAALNEYNARYFPSPEFKVKVRRKLVDEDAYGRAHQNEFLQTYQRLLAEYNLQPQQTKRGAFLDTWFLSPVRQEIDFVAGLVERIEDAATRRVIQVILSRTIRSCRATPHADLGTLLEPVTTTYYCSKHGKLCKPLFSILRWWERYSKDTLARLAAFDQLRTDTAQYCLTGDSRAVDIPRQLAEARPGLAAVVNAKKIQGIFSSPPYVGLIDYHEQHAYAYELFGFARQDELEIGPLYKGQGREAIASYVEGIANVLKNCRKFLAEDYNIFLVANDKYNIYPQIAEQAGMRIVDQFKRPVLNRTERDKAAYAETIFQLKEK